MIPAYVYAAKSTQDKHDSIPDQIRDARDVAEREGWTVLGEPFVDEAFSAYTGPRGPALADVMAAAERGAREHGEARIVVQRSDRVARGDGKTAPHLVEYVLHGRRNGFAFASKLDPHTFGAEGLVYSALGGDRGHDESKVKAGSVARGMRRRKLERGLHNGSRREKLGYKTERDPYGHPLRDRPRELDPAGARTVRRIYDAALAGVSQNQIARELNTEGVPTAAGGARWYQATVRAILTDPYYAGFLSTAPRKRTPRDDEVVKGEHDGIVTLEEWRAVQEITARRRTNGDGRPGRTSKHPALFTHGHLRCGECGAAMGFRHKPSRYVNGTDWNRYVCTARKDGGHRCSMAPVDADALDAMMLDQLKDEPGQLVGRVREAVESLLRTRDVTADRLAEAERDLARLAVEHERIERDYRAGELPARLYGELDTKVAEETAAIRAQADQLRARADELTTTLSGEEVDAAVERVMARIGEVLDDTGRIETARNVIRQAYPTVTLHREGDAVRLETPDVSPGFAQALGSTIKYDGLGR